MGENRIRPLTSEDIDLLLEHYLRHFSETSDEGLWLQPYTKSQPFNAEKNRGKIIKRWQNSVDVSVPWERCWGLFDQNHIVGHIDIRGLGLDILKHRARLGIGIEKKYQGQGWGRHLMSVAIDWCRQNRNLDWLDLDVFLYNKKARSLYKKFGFKQTGITYDRLRLDGRSIDDCQMSLKIERL